MDEKTKEVAATCLRMILADEPWQDLGFNERPKSGAFFQRFRSKWRVELEHKILQELLIVFSAAHVEANVVNASDISALTQFYVNGPDGMLWKTFGHNSANEARQHFDSAIASYLKVSTTEWLTLMSTRLDFLRLPDKKLAGTLTVGSVRFMQNVENMLLMLRKM